MGDRGSGVTMIVRGGEEIKEQREGSEEQGRREKEKGREEFQFHVMCELTATVDRILEIK